MTTQEVLLQIVGQRIVAVERDPEWSDKSQWLSGFDGPVFVLENGVRIDADGEPLYVKMPYVLRPA